MKSPAEYTIVENRERVRLRLRQSTRRICDAAESLLAEDQELALAKGRQPRAADLTDGEVAGLLYAEATRLEARAARPRR
jgi:hypothetical protein